MPKKKTKFLGSDKSKLQTFTIVPRSHRDLHDGDATAGQHVLVPTKRSNYEELSKEQLINFGIYYEDDYDYGQHLKTIDELYDSSAMKEANIRKVHLPAIAFANEPDPANRVAPLDPVAMASQPKLYIPIGGSGPADEESDNDMEDDIDEILDSDVEAALEDDADVGDDLEDDFIVLANQRGALNMNGEMMEEELERVQEFTKSNTAMWSRFFDEEEDESDSVSGDPKTSGVVSSGLKPRIGGAPLTYHEEVEEKEFEQMFAAFNRDAQSLGGSVMTGTSAVSETLTYLVGRDQAAVDMTKHKATELAESAHLKTRILHLVPEEGDIEEEETEDPVEAWVNFDRREKIDYDITSVRSSVKSENIPRIIRIPAAGDGSQRSRKPSQIEVTEEKIDDTDSDEDSQECYITGRVKGESAEERRARKKAIKEAQRVRRVEKKLNRLNFRTVKSDLVVK